ncbi:synembryn-A isoform X1 [Lethenteron reissneri]|uniref:synembryn-A isoform X1 n=1 Tax=Lethenteron reissneri TaxID=7753 RepID=UPI002AB7204A|nr:synembryn-A isoform X1 [Lethenteron reissneri]
MQASELDAVVEVVKGGDQNAVLKALQGFNCVHSQTFMFSESDKDLRETLCEAVLCFLRRDVQPACQASALESLRVLSRDKTALGSLATEQGLGVLARHAGLTYSPTASVCELPDTETMTEALKCLCNVVFNSPAAQRYSEELRLESGIVSRLKMSAALTHDVRFFDLRLLFLITALRLGVRARVSRELRGLALLTEALESMLAPPSLDPPEPCTLSPPLSNSCPSSASSSSSSSSSATAVGNGTGMSLRDIHETAALLPQTPPPCSASASSPAAACSDDREGSDEVGLGDEEGAPLYGTNCHLSRQDVERAMEILKILFNVTYDCSRRKVDEEDAAQYCGLVSILRRCLMATADGEDRTEEFHGHTVNLLTNLPPSSLEELLSPPVRPGSAEYNGRNMDVPVALLGFMEKRLDRGHRLKENLTPVVNLLTECSRQHSDMRKFLRNRVLPPLKDVTNRPEVGNTLRNKLVRLMTHIDTDVKHCAAEFLFVLCKESVARFVKYTGYGNAAGLLAARGLMAGGRGEGHYSDDSDSETEEYRQAKPNINPITGRVEEKLPNPMEGMTDEQKEHEAMKLVSMFDKLSREQIIQPMGVGMDGKLAPLEETMQNSSPPHSNNSDSDSD